jgi:hypothetical protein
MTKGSKKGDSSDATSYECDDYEIDEIASLWNQLRLDWIGFHQAKKKEKPETKGFVMLITSLLSNLKIELDATQLAEIFQLSADEIPDLNYGGKRVEASKHI